MTGQQTPTGVNQQFASAREMEHVDISGGDHVCALESGIALAVYCDTAGEILKIDNTKMTGYTTLALQAGWNEIEVTRVWQTGSTIAGNVDLGTW